MTKRISEVIQELENLKENYGDVRVMIHSTYGETTFIEDISISQHLNNNGYEVVVEMWS